MEVVTYASLAGLPMGLQLMGPPLADMDVLRLAAAYETSIGDLLSRRPPE